MSLSPAVSALVTAVKNGPPGMWRALSSPAHLAPHDTWLVLAAAAAVGVGAWALSRALRRGARPSAGSPAEVIDLAGRRRDVSGRRSSHG